MAITANTFNVVKKMDITATPFFKSAYSADLSGCESIIAAGGAGISHYITRLIIICASDITITVGDGESGSAVETIAIGPIPCVTEGSVIDLDFSDSPIKLTANKALTVDASGAGATTVLVEGFTV